MTCRCGCKRNKSRKLKTAGKDVIRAVAKDQGIGASDKVRYTSNTTNQRVCELYVLCISIHASTCIDQEFWPQHPDDEHEHDFLVEESKESNLGNPQTSKGRKAGTVNMSQEERDYMLDLIAEVKPLGERHWNRVASLLNAKFCKNRDGRTTCRKRFNEWVNSKPGSAQVKYFRCHVTSFLTIDCRHWKSQVSCACASRQRDPTRHWGKDKFEILGKMWGVIKFREWKVGRWRWEGRKWSWWWNKSINQPSGNFYSTYCQLPRQHAAEKKRR